MTVGTQQRIFVLFQKKYREVLHRFFVNREQAFTHSEAEAFADDGTLADLVEAGALLDDDGCYRLDDRVESFLEAMLDAGEAQPVQWLAAHLDEFEKWAQLFRNSADPSTQDRSLRRMVRAMSTLRLHVLRQIADLKREVDYDFRTESNYEVKEAKLQWHLKEAQALREVLGGVEERLLNAPIFLTVRDRDLLAEHSRLFRAVGAVGQGVVDVLRLVASYLNRVRRDFARARKLIRLREILDRYELEARTNVLDLSVSLTGPWVANFGYHTLLAPNIVEEKPDLVQRVLAQRGAGASLAAGADVVLAQEPVETDEEQVLVDIEALMNAFASQNDDLFLFLARVKLDGDPLTEDQRIGLFCEVLSSDEFSNVCKVDEAARRQLDQWEYVLVTPNHAAAPQPILK
jgi:hypothetical protein